MSGISTGRKRGPSESAALFQCAQLGGEYAEFAARKVAAILAESRTLAQPATKLAAALAVSERMARRILAALSIDTRRVSNARLAAEAEAREAAARMLAVRIAAKARTRVREQEAKGFRVWERGCAS